MLTVRVLPRRGTTLRAAVASLEAVAALSLGHAWAGGSLPTLPWLLVMAAVVLGAGCLVLHGRVRPRVAVPLLVATQLLLHAWLSALTMGGGMDHAMGDHAAAPLLDPKMLVVHVGGGLLTALLWELRARVADVVVTWARQPLPPLPAVRRVLAPVLDAPSLVARLVVCAAPRRGPPSRLVAA